MYARECRRSRTIGGLILGCLLLAQPAFSDDYPNKPVRIFVPYAAGGSSDYVTRLVADELSKRLGNKFVVENRPGAGEAISTQATIAAPPDGYTLGMVSNVMSLNPFIRKEMSYKIEDVALISQHITVASIVVVQTSSPPKTFPEFIEWAKIKSGKMTAGRTAPSSAIVWTRLAKATGIDYIDVPYQGNAPALVGLLGGQTDTMQITYFEVRGQLESGALRPLAVTSLDRMAVLPNVPALSEFVPKFSHVAWNGFVAPAKTPKAIIDRLSREISEIVRSPEIAKILVDRGYGVVGNTPAEFQAWIDNDLRVNEENVKAAGLTLQ